MRSPSMASTSGTIRAGSSTTPITIRRPATRAGGSTATGSATSDAAIGRSALDARGGAFEQRDSVDERLVFRVEDTRLQRLGVVAGTHRDPALYEHLALVEHAAVRAMDGAAGLGHARGKDRRVDVQAIQLAERRQQRRMDVDDRDPVAEDVPERVGEDAVVAREDDELDARADEPPSHEPLGRV